MARPCMIVYKGKQGICNFLKELWFYFKSNIVLNLKNIKKQATFGSELICNKRCGRKHIPKPGCLIYIL